MLLQEIKREPIQPKPKESPRFDPSKFPDRFRLVGHGVGSGIGASEVYIDLKHPNRALKVVRIESLADSYYRYLRLIEKHSNNPFFPKVYGIKVYADEDWGGDNYVLYVFMEQLTPLHKFSKEQVYFLLSSIGISYIGDTRKDWSLRNVFKEPNNRKRLQDTTNFKQFQQAIRLLNPLFDRFGSDLHVENFMVRKDGDKVQLVITDPLFPSSYINV
ncbi:MAG: hypothetical protein ACXW2E_00670 [Nitrososphaeraceae archaeon]